MKIDWDAEHDKLEYQGKFDEYTTRIKFLAIHYSSSGDYNKGRICLDNFIVRY